jgi:hypothetical protein
VKFLNFFFSIVLFLPVVLHASTKEKLYNVIGCEIYDMDKILIRRFPGSMCLFLDDGSILSAQKENLIFYDRYRNEIWSKKINPHHQMNFTLDKKLFLVIGSEIKEIKNSLGKVEKVRSDVLYIIDKHGEIKKTYSLYEHRNQFVQLNWNAAFNRKYNKEGAKVLHEGIDWEITHTNSFYEIPENTISTHYPEFKAGNFIINDISLMLVYIIDSDFKKVIWQSPILKDNWIMFHDVQVVPNTDLIIFYDNGTPIRPESRLVEYDLLKQKITWQFPKKFSKSFYSKKMGGLQILENGNVFYNDLTKIPTAHEISRDGKTVWTLIPREKIAIQNQYDPFQQVKRLDLSQFLKANRGL